MRKAQASSSRAIYSAAVLSGILYSSWLLGYWLNPQASRYGLASELGAFGQPYNWLFILTDVLCGASIIMIATWYLITRQLALWLRIVLGSMVIFGATTAVDALLPLHCRGSAQICADFTHDWNYYLHAAFTVIAALCLFTSLGLLWLEHKRNAVLGSLLIAYVLFSFFSLVSVILPNQGNWAQHLYLITCSIFLAKLPRYIQGADGPKIHSI